MKAQRPETRTSRMSQHAQKSRARAARHTDTTSNLLLDIQESQLHHPIGEMARVVRIEVAAPVLTAGAHVIADFEAKQRLFEAAVALDERETAAEEAARGQQSDVAPKDHPPTGSGSAALTFLVLGLLLAEGIYTLHALEVLALGRLGYVLALGVTLGVYVSAVKLASILDSLSDGAPRLKRRMQWVMALLAVTAGFVLVWELGELRVAHVDTLTRTVSVDQVGVPQGAIEAILGVGLALYALVVVVEYHVPGQQPSLSPAEWGPRLAQAWGRFGVARQQRRAVRRRSARRAAVTKAEQRVDAAKTGLKTQLVSLRILPGNLDAIMRHQIDVSRYDLLRFAGYIQKAEWPLWARLTNWLMGKPTSVPHRPLRELNAPNVRTVLADIELAVQAQIEEIEQLLGISSAQPIPQAVPLRVVPPPAGGDHGADEDLVTADRHDTELEM